MNEKPKPEPKPAPPAPEHPWWVGEICDLYPDDEPEPVLDSVQKKPKPAPKPAP